MPKNPVVLVHGIFDTDKVFRRMRSALHSRGFDVHSLNLIPNNGKAGLDRLAAQLAASIESRFGSRQPINIVGFSMGGLVARYYLQRLGGSKRVERFIAVASPHYGTWTAFLLQNAGASQMRPGSPFLKDLNLDRAALDRVRVTTIWTPFDLMIVPVRSCILSEWRSIRVNVALHRWMATDARVLKHVLELLQDDAAAPAAIEARTGLAQEQR